MRVLVLSGGGAKGAFQLGVLSHLLEDGTGAYDAIFGVSTGALSGAVLASGGTLAAQRSALRHLERIYFGLRGNRDIYRGGKTLLGQLWGLAFKGGVYDVTPLRQLIEDQVSLTALMASPTYFECGYVALPLGKYLTYSNQEGWSSPNELRRAIMWSATQPVLFRLDDPYCDGGVVHQTPLAGAFHWLKRQECNDAVLDVVLTGPVEGPVQLPDFNWQSGLTILERTFDILLANVYVNDVKHALQRNRRPGPGDVEPAIRLFAPDSDLGDGLDFSPDHIAAMYQRGEATQEHT